MKIYGKITAFVILVTLLFVLSFNAFAVDTEELFTGENGTFEADTFELSPDIGYYGQYDYYAEDYYDEDYYDGEDYYYGEDYYDSEDIYDGAFDDVFPESNTVAGNLIDYAFSIMPFMIFVGFIIFVTVKSKGKSANGKSQKPVTVMNGEKVKKTASKPVYGNSGNVYGNTVNKYTGVNYSDTDYPVRCPNCQAHAYLTENGCCQYCGLKIK